jgi:hypothetical protein
MRATDAILRTLVDRALLGERAWKNVSDLAWAAHVGQKLAYKALARPTEIGAITRLPGGGFSVTDPERVLALFSARRSLASARRTTLEAAQSLVTSADAYAIGGTRAAAHHLGGSNTIADHAPAIVYLPSHVAFDGLPRGDGAMVFEVDDRQLQDWPDGYTSPAHTYADLFAQPGWQASAFRRELWRLWFAVDDWARREERRDQVSG